ncbi:D-alanine--D-alanine ligase A [Prochlorococcus sp. MIT 0601]|nr:D-alanine--D-alanine ligase A [Prochlorococcus sp. MIT 0601]
MINNYIDHKGRWWGDPVAAKALGKGYELKEEDLPDPLPKEGFRALPKCTEEVDVWYPILHGPNGEDGVIQGLLQLTSKPFVGSGVLGSALGMDKIAMKIAFTAAGLPQVPYCACEANELLQPDSLLSLIKRIENQLGYPCFIKPANLGSSVGISKAYKREQLVKGLGIASSLDKRIVVEKSVIARELECGVLGKKDIRTSCVGEVRHHSDWYDYETKYTEGLSKTLIPAPICEETTKQIQNLALKACKAICAEGLARVDFFYREESNQIWINEINTLPGFTKQSMYPMLWRESGLEMHELVSILVETARE